MAEAKIDKELTPQHLRCGPGSCPAVYGMDDGDVLVIGKKPTDELSQETLARIAEEITSDKFAIKLSPEFLAEVLKALEDKT